MMRPLPHPLALLGVLALALPANAQQATIAATAAETEGLGTFAKLIETAGLAEQLGGDDAFTVFAPSDEAFKAAGATPDNPAAAKALLELHLVAGRHNVGAALVAGKVATVSGDEHKVGIDGGTIRVGAAGLKKANIECANGYLHIIDKVFVPTRNGILEVLAESGEHKLFLDALKTAGLDTQLAKDGPHTVFAPTDKALKKSPLPSDADEAASILRHHILAGTIKVADLMTGKDHTSLADAALAGALEDGAIQVNGVAITTPDQDADNGVVHRIDGVLIPKVLGPNDHALAIVERAIGIGSALYNGRNPLACVDVYELIMDALVQLNPEALPGDLPQAIADARETAGTEEDPKAKAWALRKGLDKVKTLLESAAK